MPDAEQWDRVNELFHRLVGLPEHEQFRMLEEECSDLPGVRSQVETLLRADRSAESFLASTRIMAADLAAMIRLHAPANRSRGLPKDPEPRDAVRHSPKLDTGAGAGGVGGS